jgi:hypothetical protein
MIRAAPRINSIAVPIADQSSVPARTTDIDWNTIGVPEFTSRLQTISDNAHQPKLGGEDVQEKIGGVVLIYPDQAVLRKGFYTTPIYFVRNSKPVANHLVHSHFQLLDH